MVSPIWLREVVEVVGRPRIARRLDSRSVDEFLSALPGVATVLADPPAGPPVSRDPDDDYLIALAERGNAVLVSGDLDLTTLELESPRILTPAAAVAVLLQ